jgi:hypothetical protein
MYQINCFLLTSSAWFICEDDIRSLVFTHLNSLLIFFLFTAEFLLCLEREYFFCNE